MISNRFEVTVFSGTMSNYIGNSVELQAKLMTEITVEDNYRIGKFV